MDLTALDAVETNVTAAGGVLLAATIAGAAIKWVIGFLI